MPKRPYKRSTPEMRLAATMKKIEKLEKASEKRLLFIGALREKAQKLQNQISTQTLTVIDNPPAEEATHA